MSSRADPIVPTLALRARLRALGAVIARADRRRFIVLIIVMLVESLAGAMVSLSLKWMIDGATSSNLSGGIAAAILAGLMAGVMGALGRVDNDIQVVLAGRVGVEVDRDTVNLTARMPGLEHLERADYLDQVAIVRNGGADMMKSVFALFGLISLSLRIIVGIWLLATVNPILVLVPVFALPSVLLVPRAQRHVNEATTISAEPRRAATMLQEQFTRPASAMELRVFGCAAALDQRADALWNQMSRIRLVGALRSALVSATGWACITVGYIGALCVVAYDVSHGSASVGDVLLVSQLALQLRGNVAQTTGIVQQTASALRLVDRYQWLHDVAESQQSAYSGTRRSPSRFEEGIRFDHVSFTYPGTDVPVLDDVSVTLPAGATVAIVGVNGAGKTSMVKLLCGFYRPTSGRILVDGSDLAEFDMDEWRAHLAGGFQDFLKLETMARHSVGCGDPPWMDDDTRVLEAFERADSRAIVAGWSAQLTTPLGKTYQQGVELSGGQWQRLAIARAMMRREPLLMLLDEPTAALDPPSEHALFERYNSVAKQLQQNRGITLLVTHRFSSVRMADIAIVVEDGRVTETGTHAELLALDGTYSSMFHQQASGYT